jgi:predicted Fe-Mo cluster-binding NifX family protein
MKRLVFVLVLCLLVVTSVTVFAADKVKIAVASDVNTPASAVISPVAAGRSPYYLIFDGKGAFIEAVSNPHKNAGKGSGTLVVDFLAGKGVTTVIAGAFGDTVIAAMKTKGINYIEFKGTVANAVKKSLKK